MIIIDGAMGEGGGQVVRSSLALSILTGTPVRIHNVRANRPKPGLRAQHVVAVQAAAAVSSARVEGAELGSREIVFHPGELAPGKHFFAIGTAGSASLVLQTVLPPLLRATAPSRLTIEGGTHNPKAPPFDFLERSFLPILRGMGAGITARLERHGFFPAGGGRIVVEIEPPAALRPFDLCDRGPITPRAEALVVNLPLHVANRELAVVRKQLSWPADCLQVREITDSPAHGNVLTLDMVSQHLTEVVTGIGMRGYPAEDLAKQAAAEAAAYLAHGAPVGEHLADQLLLPMALAGSGAFLTGPLSLHTTTNIEVIRKFLPADIQTTTLPGGTVRVELAAR